MSQQQVPASHSSGTPDEQAIPAPYVEPENQWRTRALAAATSAGLIVASLGTVRQLVRTPNFEGVFWVTFWLLLAGGCAVIAAPMRFQKRYFRYLLFVVLTMEIVINLMIVFK